MSDYLSIEEHTALIVVDMQYDFLPPHGALGVPKAVEIVDKICTIIPQYACVAATQDFHPQGHKSFASSHGKKVGDTIHLHGVSQILWPNHCVQGTFGAEIESSIKQKIDEHADAFVVQKGTNVEMDSYSGFFDNDKKTSTALHSLLQKRHITQVHVCGLATDYCVKYTVLDARALDYEVILLREFVRAVNVNPDDGRNAMVQMRDAGVRIYS